MESNIPELGFYPMLYPSWLPIILMQVMSSTLITTPTGQDIWIHISPKTET